MKTKLKKKKKNPSSKIRLSIFKVYLVETNNYIEKLLYEKLCIIIYRYT